MEATATTTAVESAATNVTAADGAGRATSIAATYCSTTIPTGVAAAIASVADTPAIAITTASITVAADAAIAITPTPSPAPAAAPIAAVPWPGADKQAASEPVGSVVAIRRAGIRIVRVVTVITDWRRRRVIIPIAAVTAAYANANCNLGISALDKRGAGEQGKKQNIS